MESEMESLREQHRKTPEITLMHQMAELKGQLADKERQNEALKAEKHQISSEKERFRQDVHKLVKFHSFYQREYIKLIQYDE